MTALRRIAVLIALGLGFAVLGYALSTALERFRDSRKEAAAGLDYSMEWRLWSDFAAQPAAALPQAVDPEFPRVLAEAYGYDTPSGVTVTELERRSFPGGRLADLRLTVQPAGFALRALHAVHRAPAATVVVILHGYHSSADKVMGEDTADYMREVGAVLYMGGADVLALDMPSDPARDAAMNMSLMAGGMTVDGVWARAACGAVDALDLRRRHSKIFLYALRRAARVGEVFAVLCPPIAQIVLEPASFDRRQAVLHDLKRRTLMQPMAFATLKPLLGRDSFANFAAHSRSRIAYVQTDEAWADAEGPVWESFRRVDFEHARIGVILRRFATRVTNDDRLERLIRGEPVANTTIGLEPR